MDNEEDVLEKNEELNAKLEERETVNTINPFVRWVLVFITFLCIFIIVFIIFSTIHRSSQLSKSDVRQTQLLCAGVPHPMQYSICRQVGLPQRIGEVK